MSPRPFIALFVMAAVGFGLMYAAGQPFARQTSGAAADSGVAGVTPTPVPVSFALGIDVDSDGDNDCGTGVPATTGDGAPDAVPVQLSDTTCSAQSGAEITANAYLIDASGLAYGAIAAHIEFTGLTSSERGTSLWTGCAFPVSTSSPTIENAGCAIGLNASGQTNVGLVVRFTLACTASGSVELRHGGPYTSLVDEDITTHIDVGQDVLNVTCGGSEATPTPTQVGDPTSVPTNGPPTSTSTPVATSQPTPTSTPVPPTATPTHTVAASTSTPPSGTPFPQTATVVPTGTTTPIVDETGDVNCNGHTTNVDAALLLQLDAGIIFDVPCPFNADVNHDGRLTPLDAALILQHDAGIIDSWP